MKFLTVLACVLFSGSMAFSHCGSCGTGEAKAEKHSCSKSKKKGHKCGKECKDDHKKHDKKTNGHKAHNHDH